MSTYQLASFQAAKTLSKGVEESLKTGAKSKHDDLEARRRRSLEYQLGEQLASAATSLKQTKSNEPTIQSPLETIIERYANFEKTIGERNHIKSTLLF